MSLKRPLEEETAFPRGGAVSKVLTPLEIKQARNEGRELFEASKSNNKRVKRAKKDKDANLQSSDSTTLISIKPLTLQKLLPGTCVLGQISKVSELEMVLALPNNLVGYIPVTNICRQLSERIEEDEDDEDDESEESGHGGQSPTKSSASSLSLTSLFSPGQWLRAEIAESERSATTQKVRLELSVSPENVNCAIKEADLVEGQTVQGAIKSIEDHGVIVDVGIDGVSGFISHKEIAFEKDKKDIKIQPNQVFLFSVLKKSGRTLTLTLSPRPRKLNLMKSAASITSLVPGTLVEAVIMQSLSSGLVAEVFGFISATIDLVHSGVLDRAQLGSKFKVGEKVMARVLFSPQIEGDDEDNKLSLTLLPSALDLSEPEYAHAFATGHTMEATVEYVDRPSGLFMNIGIKGKKGEACLGFVPLSKISDDRVDDIDTDPKYKKGTRHTVRVVKFSPSDNLYYLTMQNSVIARPYLSMEDIPVGAVVEGKIDRRLPTNAFLVTLWEGCQGYVADNQLSDVKLPNPEKKFKRGSKVECRVLEVDPDRRRLRLTLKKSIVKASQPIISSYNVEVGATSLGTVASLKPNGGVVEFFNGVRAYLPVGEMSESYVTNPTDVLSVGQTVKVRVLSVEPGNERMSVSCRMAQLLPENIRAFDSLVVGSVINAIVAEKIRDTVVVELAPKSENSDALRSDSLLANIDPGHLCDDFSSVPSTVKKLQVGGTVDVVVLSKNPARRVVTVSAKPSLVSDAKSKRLPLSFYDIKEGQTLHGYVDGTTEVGVFIAFGNDVTGLAYARDLSIPVTAFSVNQSIECIVRKVDSDNQRFFVVPTKLGGGNSTSATSDPLAITSASSSSHLIVGSKVQATIAAVRPSHLDVKIDGTHARVDVSMCCDAKDIVDPKKVTAQFEKGQVVQGRIISVEHGLQVSLQKQILEARSIELPTSPSIGSKWTVFVESVKNDFLFVSVTPMFKGKMSVLDAGLDIRQCPVGSMIENCTLVGVESTAVAASSANSSPYIFRHNEKIAITTFEDAIKHIGETVPAMVIKPNDTFVLLRLGGETVASAYATDALDEFKPLEEAFEPLQLVDAKILDVDQSKHRIFVSLRGDDESAEADKCVNRPSDVAAGDVLSGYICNVARSGLFVSLGRTVTGRVQIREMFDFYVKEWQKHFKVGQVVRVKVLSVNSEGQIELSVRPSQVGTALANSSNIEGKSFSGTVDRVEDYGVFVRMDEIDQVGLCHRSQIADQPVQDVSKLFSVGDVVKVKVLKVDPENKKLSLGMKASYFEDEDEAESGEESGEESVDEAQEEGSDDSMDVDEENQFLELPSDSESEDEESEDEQTSVKPLSVGFDWTANVLEQIGGNAADNAAESSDEELDEDDEEELSKQKRRKKSQITQDKTATLNTKLPQSVADFERLLVGSPNSSIVWMNYMAFQLQLSEIEKAREVGRRALQTINFREEQEKQNIWIALLNLENSFGTDQTLEDTFKEAVQYMDSKTMHLKMANIYVQSGKIEKANKMYETIIKKFANLEAGTASNGADSISLYVLYGNFLMDNDMASKTHGLLDRALKALPQREHREVLTKFAQLEYSKGDIERGRTLFEGLVSTYKRRVDLWSIYVDQEIKAKQRDAVEKLFERIIGSCKLSMKQAKFFFKKWLAYEDKYGDDKSVDYVKSKAAEYVSSKQKEEDEEEEE